MSCLSSACNPSNSEAAGQPVVSPSPLPTSERTSSLVPKKEDDPDELDSDGYDLEGFDASGRDREGYGRDGLDANGLPRKGFDKHGYDQYGLDHRGFDAQGRRLGLLWNKVDLGGKLVWDFRYVYGASLTTVEVHEKEIAQKKRVLDEYLIDFEFGFIELIENHGPTKSDYYFELLAQLILNYLENFGNSASSLNSYIRLTDTLPGDSALQAKVIWAIKRMAFDRLRIASAKDYLALFERIPVHLTFNHDSLPLNKSVEINHGVDYTRERSRFLIETLPVLLGRDGVQSSKDELNQLKEFLILEQSVNKLFRYQYTRLPNLYDNALNQSINQIEDKIQKIKTESSSRKFN